MAFLPGQKTPHEILTKVKSARGLREQLLRLLLPHRSKGCLCDGCVIEEIREARARLKEEVSDGSHV